MQQCFVFFVLVQIEAKTLRQVFLDENLIWYPLGESSWTRITIRQKFVDKNSWAKMVLYKSSTGENSWIRIPQRRMGKQRLIF